ARRAAGLGYGVAAGALFGGYFVLLALASGETGLWPLLASRAVTTALLASVAVAGKRDWIRPPSGTTAGAVIGVGALDVVGNIGYLLAAGVGNLVMVAVVASLYPAVTVALARIVYDESLSGPQLAGVMLAPASVACFSIPCPGRIGLHRRLQTAHRLAVAAQGVCRGVSEDPRHPQAEQHSPPRRLGAVEREEGDEGPVPGVGVAER